MGAAESVIRNVDKRTSRRENREAFLQGIEDFKRHPETFEPQAKTAPLPQHNHVSCGEQVVQVAVRKRPIFPHEIEKGEFDVVTCCREKNRVTIHDARMGADMKQRFLDHHHFDFNAVFSEEDSSDRVFDTVVQPLVDLVRTGGNGTVMMYGQTGSGKTFTMSHCYSRCSWELFRERLGELNPVKVAFVSFFELAGDTVFDVLNKHRKLSLMSCPNGDVMAYPAVQVAVNTPQELHDCLKFASSLRATAATGVHDQSSRSHAICRIELEGANSLTLVDLAGSEHRIDSAEHDLQRRKESAQINSSLMKLKECIRARARQASYVPYRQSKLTHLLRPSFVEDDEIKSRTIIIATVSPSSKDTEHSLNTVRHACIMDGQGQDSADKSWVTGGVTVRQNLEPVDVCVLARKAKEKRDAIRNSIQGNDTSSSWGQAPGRNHSRDGSFDKVSKAAEEKKVQKILERARREAEVAGIRQLSPSTKEKLTQARESAGEMQRTRMNSLKHREDLLKKQAEQDLRQKEARKREKERLARMTLEQETQNRPVEEPEQQRHDDLHDNLLQPASRLITWPEMKEDIRRRVWSDPRVPDDQKEEQIVELCRVMKQRMNIVQQQQPPKNVRVESQRPKQQPVMPEPKSTLHLQQQNAIEETQREESLDRHEQAKLIRERKIAEEKRKAEEKLQAKLAKHAAVSNNVTELQNEVLRVQQELEAETDRMKVYGLKQQLAKAKAALIRETRKKNTVQ